MGAIDTSRLERDMTAHFGGVLGLAVDEGIFRGAVPEGVAEGVAVRIVGNPKSHRLDQPMFIVQVLGKFLDRDDAWSMLARVSADVPAYGRQTPNFVLVCMLPGGEGGAPYEAQDKGVRKWFASVNLRLCVLTR